MTPLRILLVYASAERNATLAYQHGWPRHFLRHPGFECVPLNLLGPSRRWRQWVAAVRVRRLDAVVLLHSVFSNERHLGERLAARLRGLAQPKALFLANEYKLMPEKLQLCDELGVSLVVSQLLSGAAKELYRARLGCEVVGISSAGLDTELFRPTSAVDDRPIEIGYRGYENAMYLGHVERRVLVERFSEACARLGVGADLSLDPADRLDERRWAAFLNRCRGQLGSAAGGDYFELTDATRLRVNDYLARTPDATFEDVHDRFFRSYGPAVSGRAVSGRIVEAAGTRTVQVLLEGDYGGFFLPDVHYIPVRSDFSNVDEAILKLRDDALCSALTDEAYRMAVEEFRYERLIDRFRDALVKVI